MKYLVYLLWFYSLSALSITQIPGLVVDQKHPEVGQQVKSDELLPPNPIELKADWWQYFEVENAALPKRIETATQQFQKVLQSLPESGKADDMANIKHFNLNMQALVELRKNSEPETLPSVVTQKTYTLKQWLDLVHKQRTIQAEIKSVNEDLLSDEKRLKAMRQSFDTLTAAYLVLPEQSNIKATHGFALMATWSQVAVNIEHLRLQKSVLTEQKNQLSQLVEESAAAQNKLTADESDLPRLHQDVEVAERELSAAHDKASQLTASSLAVNLETDGGKSRALLFQQQLRHSSIEETIADTLVFHKQIELELTQILIKADIVSPSELRKRLQDGLDKIGDFEARLEIWREEAERDQGRAGKSLAALFGATTQQSKELINLTQQRLAEAQNTLLALQRLDGELHDAQLFADRLQILIADREGGLKSGVETIKTTTNKVGELIWSSLGDSLFKIGETPVTVLAILRVLLIVTLAWSVSHFVRRGLAHLRERQKGNSAFLYTLGRLTHYLILIIGISIGLSSVGVDLSSFAMIAGALSLGIGFGLQAIVSNFVSGLIVLFERSLRIGDFVELSSGLAGEVRAINVRSTLVTTTDMVEILVPNSEFVNGKVINWTLTDASRRIHIPFGVAYGSDKELVRMAGLEAAGKTPHTLKNRIGREPEVWLTKFGESSLDFELVVWVEPQAVKKPQRVRAAYYWELETALRKYGIEIPFPQRDLHLRSGLKETSMLIKEPNQINEL